MEHGDVKNAALLPSAAHRSARPRVVIATPVLLAGGTEAQTLTLAKVLLAAGWEVTVCCYHESDPIVASAFEEAGARVLLLGLSRRLDLIGVAGALRSAFRASRADVVHVQYLAPGFTAVLAARAARVKTVFATVHQPGSAHGPRERLLVRAAALFCTRFFAVSTAVERSWFGDACVLDPDLRHLRERHATIYNTVDTPAIVAAGQGSTREDLRGRFGIAADAPVVGFVGRLRHEKGLDVLISALPLVLVDFPKARLLVVGDGPEAASLSALAEQLGVSDRMVWVGRCDRLEVWRLLAALELLAVPSRFEGFGLAAAEAQAAGLPVVASRVDGLAEVVRDGETGLLVAPGDPEALAAAIRAMLEDPPRARRMGLAGRQHVAASFSPERFAAAIQAVYRTCAASAAR